jgi:5-hydroxyisourate hydrolase-like protein (transthyretin family)
MQLPRLAELQTQRRLSKSEGPDARRVASNTFAFLSLFAAFCLNASAAAGYSAFPQSTGSKAPSGSISGQITKDGKPAAGVTVVLAPPETSERASARTTTDEDGRFQLSRVPAGRYMIKALAPAFVGPTSERSVQPAKVINLADGESVDGIDIALTRGGVITGKIIDANGQPLVQEPIQLTRLHERGQKSRLHLPHSFMFPTDDRGVYRLFGVPRGRYVVSVGVDERRGYPRVGLGKRYHALTYHPDTTDESKAKIVEVTSGSEATGVDITLGLATKSYRASGRIIDAATGKPVAGINYGYGSLAEERTHFQSAVNTGFTSNLRGEFDLEGIPPGHYAAFAASTGENSIYSDPAPFEIIDSDVEGLVIKLRRGSTLTGVVVVEGATPPEGLSKVSDLRLSVDVASQSIAPSLGATVHVSADGSFRATGLRPGKVGLHFYSYPIPKGLSLLRVERDGVEQTDGIEIGPGEHVSGVKVVVAFGTGVIRGQVKFEGGAPREGSQIQIACRKAGNDSEPYIQPVMTDLRGRFDFEGLLTGEYELSMTAMVAPVTAGPPSPPRLAKQMVSIVNGMETEVTFVIDLNEGKQ